MKIVISAALLGSLVAPAFSLSYLESLNAASATLAPPSGGASAGAGASYLDALASPMSAAPTGSGMTSYLDALPSNAAAGTSGAGMTSYTDVISGAAPAAPSTPAFVTPQQVAETPSTSSYVPDAPSAPVVAGGNYLEAINAVSSAGAPSGSGMTTYLDALPRTSVPMAGAGIQSYSNNLPVMNTVSGSGVPSYTDNLSGGIASSSKSFSPFSSAAGSTFSGSVGGSEIGFTLEADNLSALLEQLRGNGGTIKLSGSIESVSYN